MDLTIEQARGGHRLNGAHDVVHFFHIDARCECKAWNARDFADRKERRASRRAHIEEVRRLRGWRSLGAE